MKAILATGIYPPDIGGPATYCAALAGELVKAGVEVVVVTYGREDRGARTLDPGTWKVIPVNKKGGPVARWLRYRAALRTHGRDADAILAFSSVSAGIPLILSGVPKHKRILRLGGDFFWERYTNRGGMLTLSEWYAAPGSWFWRVVMRWILHSFGTVVYSTEWQKRLHEKHFRLQNTAVIWNAAKQQEPIAHRPHEPFRLLFMGRFVGFKNLPALIGAMKQLPDVHLTLAGAGPMEESLRELAQPLGSRIAFRSPVSGAQKARMFDDADVLILPSTTEISPNVALEAVARSLPVLLTEESGLQEGFSGLILRRRLRTSQQIAAEVRSILKDYPRPQVFQTVYDWPAAAKAWIALFQKIAS